MSVNAIPPNPNANISVECLQDCLKDSQDFFQQYRETTERVLENYHSDDPAIRDAIVYWTHPDLDPNQKKRILTECSDEIEVIRRHLWNEGYEIMWRRREEAYQKLPWVFKKFDDFTNYLAKDPLVNRCKVFGTALVVISIAVFLFEKSSKVFPILFLIGGALVIYSFFASKLNDRRVNV